MNSLNSAQLDAFEAVAKLGSFSMAALELRLTQPALSRRIQGLEEDVGHPLFIRESQGVILTEPGQRLLEYVHAKRVLEGEMLSELGKDPKGQLGGTIRIAGYSSMLRYFVAPVVAPFLRENPEAQLHFTATQAVRPLDRLHGLVQRSEADFLLTARKADHPKLVMTFLGYHYLVAIQSKRYAGREDTFLDTRPEDLTTLDFLAAQSSKRKPARRSFVHDEEGILNGVVLGLGQGVIYRDLIPKTAPVKLVKGLSPVSEPVYLFHRRQTYYPKLHTMILEILKKGMQSRLDATPRYPVR